MIKKKFLFKVLILSIFFSQSVSISSPAQEQPEIVQNNFKKEENTLYTYYIKNNQLNIANELNTFLSSYLIALNSHNIKSLDDCYASNYISGDGFNKTQLMNLIKQTWEKYPDLKYTTVIKNLRFDNNRASVEFKEDVVAMTKDASKITKDRGLLKGTAQSILYLEKYGCGWKIITDKTLYEETDIKYGTAKNININFDVPEQVLTGENYTSALKIDVPSDIFALGSLTSQPIRYSAPHPEEIFRQISAESGILERVIKSNKNNLNEIAAASVSFCEAQRIDYTNLDLKVTGLAVVLKRINVLPAHKLIK
jgi:hypothetical protein